MKNKPYRIVTNCFIILKDLGEGKSCKRKDYAARFGVNERTVSRYLKVLQDAGFKIEYNFSSGSYELKNNKGVN